MRYVGRVGHPSLRVEALYQAIRAYVPPNEAHVCEKSGFGPLDALAAAAPAVMLEHRPNCLDFARPIGKEAMSLRTVVSTRDRRWPCLKSCWRQGLARGSTCRDGGAIS